MEWVVPGSMEDGDTDFAVGVDYVGGGVMVDVEVMGRR